MKQERKTMGLFHRLSKRRTSQQNPANPTILAPEQSQAPEDPFEWLEKRRHVTNAPYVLPSDQAEINRLDFQHYLLRYAFQGNYVVPLQEPHMILDVGCGTGRWATEMAIQFPKAQVIGLDLVLPTANNELQLPANLQFIQGNVLDGLPFAEKTFDFVHQRLLLFAIPKASWLMVIQELIRITRPGGWIQTIETGPQRNCGLPMNQLIDWITIASQKRGVDPLFGPRVGGLLRDAGLAQMHSRQVAVPIGASGGHLGMMAQTDVFGVVESVKPLVVSQGITTASQYEGSLAAARVEIEHHKGELPFYLAYGQRSLSF